MGAVTGGPPRGRGGSAHARPAAAGAAAGRSALTGPRHAAARAGRGHPQLASAGPEGPAGAAGARAAPLGGLPGDRRPSFSGPAFRRRPNADDAARTIPESDARPFPTAAAARARHSRKRYAPPPPPLLPGGPEWPLAIGASRAALPHKDGGAREPALLN